MPARRALHPVPQFPRPEDSRTQGGFSPSSQRAAGHLATSSSQTSGRVSTTRTCKSKYLNGSARRVQSRRQGRAALRLLSCARWLGNFCSNLPIQKAHTHCLRVGLTPVGAQHGGLSLVSLSKKPLPTCSRPAASQASWSYVLGLGQSSAISLSSLRQREICSLRFAIRFVQQARITFRVSAIACQVVCGTSLEPPLRQTIRGFGNHCPWFR